MKIWLQVSIIVVPQPLGRWIIVFYLIVGCMGLRAQLCMWHGGYGGDGLSLSL